MTTASCGPLCPLQRPGWVDEARPPRTTLDASISGLSQAKMSSLWPAAVRHATKVLSGTLQDSDVPLLVTPLCVTRMNECSAKPSRPPYVMYDAPCDSHSSQSWARHCFDARG